MWQTYCGLCFNGPYILFFHATPSCLPAITHALTYGAARVTSAGDTISRAALPAVIPAVKPWYCQRSAHTGCQALELPA